MLLPSGRWSLLLLKTCENYVIKKDLLALAGCCKVIDFYESRERTADFAIR
jgi:hypothetical protein